MGKIFFVTADFNDRESGEEIKAGAVFKTIDDEHEARLRAAGVIGREVPEEGKDGSQNTEWPKHVGGGNFELSNGERVRGKEEAAEKQALIDAAEKTDANNAG